jgi:hypothetical protein
MKAVFLRVTLRLLFLFVFYFMHPSIGVQEFGACPHLRDPVFWGTGSVSFFDSFFLKKNVTVL